MIVAVEPSMIALESYIEETFEIRMETALKMGDGAVLYMQEYEGQRTFFKYITPSKRAISGLVNQIIVIERSHSMRAFCRTYVVE